MRMVHRLFALLFLTVVFPMVGHATVHNIDMNAFSFSPLGTVVTYGDTVRWHVLGGIHTTTSDVSSPKTWNSGTMSTIGQTFDVVFTAANGPGPFPYHCTFHVSFGMVDTIRAVPPATGACCLPNGACIDATSANCQAAGGSYNGDGTACSSTQCPQPVIGACCLPGGLCLELTAANCALGGGVYQGDNSSCVFTQCPTSCCNGTTGNVDGDPSDVVDISDLSAMVDYLFFGGTISSCFKENDVDTSTSVDISDLQALIDFLFFGASLPNCP